MRNPISGAATTRDIVLLAASDIGAPLTSFTLAGAMQSPELESEAAGRGLGLIRDAELSQRSLVSVVEDHRECP
jgi:hypothetical protein